MASPVFPVSHHGFSIGSPLSDATAVRRGDALRVLLLNYEFPPLGGGAGIASAALAERLASRGVVVDVVTSRPRDARDAERISALSC
ncbi:MAG: hypothetical protein JJD97_10140, partial [Gemmatimonadaceae bacterium]|nr:hypothetical protein [Gemmatimonadaceae bacterium]